MEVAPRLSDDFGALSLERFHEQRQQILPFTHAQNGIDFDSVSLQTCATESDIFDRTPFNTPDALIAPTQLTRQNVERLNQQQSFQNQSPTKCHIPENSATVSAYSVSNRDNTSAKVTNNLHPRQIMAPRFLKNQDSNSRLIPHNGILSHLGRQNSLVGIENTSLENADTCDSTEPRNVSDMCRVPTALQEEHVPADRPNLLMPRFGGVPVFSRQHLNDTHDNCSVHTEYSTTEFNVPTEFNTARDSRLMNSESRVHVGTSPVESFEKTILKEFKTKNTDVVGKSTSAMTCWYLPVISFLLAILSLLVCSVLIFRMLALPHSLSSNRKYIPCDVMLQLSRNSSLLNDTERLETLAKNSLFKAGNSTCLDDNGSPFLLEQRLDSPRTLPKSQFLKKRSGSGRTASGRVNMESPVVTKTGHYFLYFGVHLVYGGSTRCSKLKNKLLEAALVKTNKHYHDVKVVVTEHTCCQDCPDERGSKFAGGIFHLEKGTRLQVKVSNMLLVKDRSTYMESWLLHEDGTD